MNGDFPFAYSSPEKQGIPSSALLSFIEAIEREHIELHSFILMRHRYIVAEGYWAPFDPHQPHRLFSAGKAVVALAILFAIQEQRLRLEDRVADLLPDKMPEHPSDRLKRLNLYHLLTMHTGHDKDPFAAMLQPGVDRARVFFEQALVYEPGTHFLYNNGVPDILGIILHRLTGESVFDYLAPRVFEPLGMTGMTVMKNGELDELPTMAFRSRDFFKLTLLFAEGGRWEGKPLLDERLVRDACSYLVPSLQRPEPPYAAYDTKFGYGYQIWRNSVGGFRLDGGRGQFGIVVPEMDIVAVINANEPDQSIIPVLFWKHVTNRLYARPIHEDDEVLEQQQRLREKFGSLTWHPAMKGGDKDKGTVANFQRRYTFHEAFCGCRNLHIEVREGGKEIILQTDRHGKTIRAQLAADRWSPCTVPFAVPEIVEAKQKIRLDLVAGADPEQAVGAYCRPDAHTLEVHFRSAAWMGAHVFRMVFHESGLTITYEPGTSYNLKHRTDITPRGLREQWITAGVEGAASLV
jgi:CubicO group peptidase (beta-lactamase class C family)